MDAARILSLGIVAAMIFVAVRRWRARRAAGRQAAETSSTQGAPRDPNQPTLPVERAFTDGATFGTAPNIQTIEVRRIGELVLATGRIVACDPLVFPETPPFSRGVTPGEYQVEVSIARQPNGDERIAAARVTFRPGAPTRWEHALLDGGQLKSLKAGELFGYGVDAGVGCFMDVATARLLLAAMKALPADRNYFDDVLAAQMAPVSKPTRDWASHRPEPSRRDNMVVFTSGWGDGHYSSWWGLDDAGQPLMLVTDFDVLEDAK